MRPDPERSNGNALPRTSLAPFPGPSGPPHRCNVVNREDAAERAECDRVLAEVARRLPDLIDGRCDEVVICIDTTAVPVSDDVRKSPCDCAFKILANVAANIRLKIGCGESQPSLGADCGKPVEIEIEMMSL